MRIPNPSMKTIWSVVVGAVALFRVPDGVAAQALALPACYSIRIDESGARRQADLPRPLPSRLELRADSAMLPRGYRPRSGTPRLMRLPGFSSDDDPRMIQVWVAQGDSVLADWSTGFGAISFRVLPRGDSLSGTVRFSSDDLRQPAVQLNVVGSRVACESRRNPAPRGLSRRRPITHRSA
jgi:hypothetical protein